MPVLEITYKCWGCGSEVVEEEEVEPLRDSTSSGEERWNLCPDCVEEKES